ncbi:MAG: hypothetical protein AAF719_13920 [Pseudomonadota bacterium]
MKFAALIAASALMAAPAMAGVATIEFANDDGNTSTWTFNDETMMATADGVDAGAYTWDEAAATLCGATPDGEVCATFDDPKSEVGHSSTYTLSTGGGGTATIKALEE